MQFVAVYSLVPGCRVGENFSNNDNDMRVS